MSDLDTATQEEETTPATPPDGGVSVGDKPEAKTNGSDVKVADDITASEVEPKEAPAVWPEDWRNRLAGKDDSALKRLNRFQSPEGIYKSWRSLEQRLSSGELKSALPKDASEEQVAEWRKEVGLPEEPNGYELPEVSGHEWTDADKPTLEKFLGVAHTANLNQEQVNAALSWYVQEQQSILDSRYEGDVEARQTLEDELRSEWGHEFRSNVGLMKRYMEAELPEGAAEVLTSVRMDDGTRLIDNPWFAKWMAQIARDTYGDVSFIGGEGVAAISNRMKEVQEILRSDPDRYWREGLDKEYLSLKEKEAKSKR